MAPNCIYRGGGGVGWGGMGMGNGGCLACKGMDRYGPLVINAAILSFKNGFESKDQRPLHNNCSSIY